MTIIAVLQISAICVVRQPLESMESQFGPITVLIQGPAKSRGGLRSLEINNKNVRHDTGAPKRPKLPIKGDLQTFPPFLLGGSSELATPLFFWVDLQSLLHPFFSGWIFRACYTPFDDSSDIIIITFQTNLRTFNSILQFYWLQTLAWIFSFKKGLHYLEIKCFFLWVFCFYTFFSDFFEFFSF